MRLPQDRILHIGTEFKDGKVNIVAEWQGELVRCKDCRYYECGGLPCPLDVCESLGDNGFCSYGERKGGDDE